MARISRLLFSLAYAMIIVPLFAVGHAVSFVARSIVYLYQPTARESLALDRMVQPVAILPKLRSRFMAFIDSARTHADFTAGHFDPGRMAA
jgi:hypothetical protein